MRSIFTILITGILASTLVISKNAVCSENSENSENNDIQRGRPTFFNLGVDYNIRFCYQRDVNRNLLSKDLYALKTGYGFIWLRLGPDSRTGIGKVKVKELIDAANVSDNVKDRIYYELSSRGAAILDNVQFAVASPFLLLGSTAAAVILLTTSGVLLPLRVVLSKNRYPTLHVIQKTSGLLWPLALGECVNTACTFAINAIEILHPNIVNQLAYSIPKDVKDFYGEGS